MTNQSVGFIGGGRVTGIFLEGWKRAGKMPGNIVASDSNPDALAEMEAQVSEMYRTRLPSLFQKIKP